MSLFEKNVFAKTLPFTRVETVNEALDIAKDLVVTPSVCSLSDIALSPEGTLLVGSTELLMTTKALEGICKILGIPIGFARTIPADLLLENIQRLQTENPAQRIVLLQRRTEEVAGVVKDPYSEASYADVISTFSEKEGIKYFELGEELLTIALTFDKQFYGRDEGDYLYVGTFIYNSILKETSLHMFSGLWRTGCRNSFLAPYLGKIRANYQKEDILTRLASFADNVACYDDTTLARIEQNFSSLTNKRYFVHEVAGLWKKLSRYIGQSDADALLKMGEEGRKQLIDSANVWTRKNRLLKLQGKPAEEPSLTDIVPYDVVNDITSYAQRLHGLQKRTLEKFAGALLEEVVLP